MGWSWAGHPAPLKPRTLDNMALQGAHSRFGLQWDLVCKGPLTPMFPAFNSGPSRLPLSFPQHSGPQGKMNGGVTEDKWKQRPLSSHLLETPWPLQLAKPELFLPEHTGSTAWNELDALAPFTSCLSFQVWLSPA